MGEFSISDAIQQFLDQSRIKGDIQALQIEEAWEQIMGKPSLNTPTNSKSSAIN